MEGGGRNGVLSGRLDQMIFQRLVQFAKHSSTLRP